MDCIFCKIIKGEIPSYKIYEDQWTYSFLDISNDGNGHVLVIPKKHCKNVLDCDNETLSHVMDTVKKVSNHLVDNCGFDGVNILNASGEDAQQSVFHLHFHILPRLKGDQIDAFPSLEKREESLESLCERLKIKEGEKVVLYTDGACSGNPGKGGYCAILNFAGKEKIVSGGEENTTNNRMELMAVIKGLEALKGSQDVEVFSDSAYVINAFEQGWVDSWIKNNWRNSQGKEVLNEDLWRRLLTLTHKHKISWNKVKGHSDNEMNNRCDEIARSEIKKL